MIDLWTWKEILSERCERHLWPIRQSWDELRSHPVWRSNQRLPFLHFLRHLGTEAKVWQFHLWTRTNHFKIMSSLLIHNNDDYFIHALLCEFVQSIIYLFGSSLWINTSRSFSGKSSFPFSVPFFENTFALHSQHATAGKAQLKQAGLTLI